MKFIYSQLESDSVLEIVTTRYELGDSVSSKFYVLGLHDNYLVESNERKYIFRVYRNNWRTEEEILFELDLLSYINKTSSNVAAPVQTINSELATSIETPEGIRIGVLFNYADGCPHSGDISCEDYKLLGVSVANLHENSERFETNYKRKILDLPFLVDHSLMLIAPFLNASQMKYLNSIKSLIYANMSHLNPENSDFGICIGDINLTNFHINTKNIITHFDFDQCGYGYRVFELGKFSSTLRNDEFKKNNMRSFMKGYESIRMVSDVEKMAIPYFEIASVIWVMSIHVCNVDKIGYKYLNEEFWKHRIGIIEGLVADSVLP